MDEFEGDLKLMAEEAKEVRDRLKADLARVEARAAALESGGAAVAAATPATTPAGAESGVTVGAGGSGGGGSVPGRARGGGDEAVLRRALADVDKATNQLARAATAVDMACFLRDAALSFLQE